MKLTRKDKTKEYILEADRGSDNPTVFHYRKLRWKEMNKLNKMKVMDIETAFEVTKIVNAAKNEGRDHTPEENARLKKLLKVDEEFLDKLAEMKAAACGMGLVKIEGMLDDDGEPYDIKVSDFVEIADGDVLREVGDVIILDSKIPGGNNAEKK